MFIDYSDEQRKHQADRIARVFKIPDAGMKVTRDGVRMESAGDGRVYLYVELVEVITEAEASALINALPIDEEEVSK